LLREAMNEGKKACTKAPSAKIRRKRFGNLKATKKISLKIFTPKIDAIKRSRRNPKTRETKIPKLFVKIFRTKCYPLQKRDYNTIWYRMDRPYCARYR
jgi:hypothetical protein